MLTVIKAQYLSRLHYLCCKNGHSNWLQIFIPFQHILCLLRIWQDRLNLLPLPQLASYFTAIYSYKILKLMTPEYVYNQILNQFHRFPIRDVNILKAPNDNNFLNRIEITFNNLPENIKSQTKFSSFKNLSFRHFMSHPWPYFRHLTDNSFAISHLI